MTDRLPLELIVIRDLEAEMPKRPNEDIRHFFQWFYSAWPTAIQDGHRDYRRVVDEMRRRGMDLELEKTKAVLSA